MSDVTQLLNAIEAGDPCAANQLLPLVYDELRKLAAARMATERLGHTLQPTALVHEAWLKISGDGGEQFANRRHFFSAAATAMQRILVDSARRRNCAKHGGGEDGEELHESQIMVPTESDELLAINDALAELERQEPEAAEIVRLRYFVGLSVQEIATAMNLAPRTVHRHWTFARAWLKRFIQGSSSGLKAAG